MSGKSQPKPGSFGWAVKNPGEFESWAESEAKEHRKRQAERDKRLSPQEIERLINRLKDPAARNPTGKKERWNDEYPLESILERLKPYGPPALVPVIADLVKHENMHVRKAVALALGNVANDESVAPLSVCLADEDDYVRSYAMMGIDWALAAGRPTVGFKKAVFEKLVPLVNRHDSSVSGDAPRLLLAMDRERAIKLLLNERYFSVKNGELHYTLKALNKENVVVPVDKLRLLMQELRPKRDEYPYDYCYAECLKGLALAHPTDAETVIREALGCKSKEVYVSAAHALLMLHGLPDNIWKWLCERMEVGGFEGLSDVHRNCIWILELDAQVDNGGFSQYFFNSDGDGCRGAMKALRAIGDDAIAAILGKAMAEFGPKGPSPSRDARMRQLAKFSKQQDKALDDLSSAFYATNDRWQVFMAEYILKNLSEFKGPVAQSSSQPSVQQ